MKSRRVAIRDLDDFVLQLAEPLLDEAQPGLHVQAVYDPFVGISPKEMATERRKPTPEKQPPGRPRHIPTQKDREIVSFASAIGTPQATIGRLIGISEHTLREHYRDELDLGMARANISVGRNLYRIATGNTPQAAPAGMFWMKTRAGWKETVRQKNMGPDGGPIEFNGMSAREIIESRLARIRERMEEDKNPRRLVP